MPLHNLAWARFHGSFCCTVICWLPGALPPLAGIGLGRLSDPALRLWRVPGPDSAIREIDDLARAMSSMRLTLGNFSEHGPGAGGRASLRFVAQPHPARDGGGSPGRGRLLFWPRRRDAGRSRHLAGQPLACEQVQWQALLPRRYHHTERLLPAPRRGTVGPLPSPDWALPVPANCWSSPFTTTVTELIGCPLLILGQTARPANWLRASAH